MASQLDAVTPENSSESARNIMEPKNSFAGLAFHNSKSMSLAQLYTWSPAAWQNIMAYHFARLPEAHIMDGLVSYYLRELEPYICCANSVILLDEYTQLKGHIAAVRNQETTAERGNVTSIAGSLSNHGNRVNEPLPLATFWTKPHCYSLLALLFAILQTACDYQPKSSDHTIRASHKQDMSQDLRESSYFFLFESNFQLNPTLWALQTIILHQVKPQYSLHVPAGSIWISMALNMAQIMGLNRLGSASDDILWVHCNKSIPAQHDILQHMPWLKEFSKDDLPRRELARKIWTKLVMWDWFASIHVNYTYSVPEEMNCTAPPAPLSDEEVMQIASIPTSVLTDMERVSPTVYCRILLDISRCVRQTAAILIRKTSLNQPRTTEHHEALGIDKQLLQIMNSIPRYFRFDGSSELDGHIRLLHIQYPYLSLQRLYLQEQFHYRMILLHSPFLLLALRSEPYHRSLTACIEGARTIVAVWEELRRTEIPNPHVHYNKWHLLSAAVVLARVLGTRGCNATEVDNSLDLALRKAIDSLHSPQVFQSFERLLGTDTSTFLNQCCAPNNTITTEAPAPTTVLDELMKNVSDWGLDDNSLLAGLEMMVNATGTWY